MPPPLDKLIEDRIGEVRTDAFDITFGEIISLYENREFTIAPDFQRFFRWSGGQRSRLIESVLLELPIPQVFVIETATGVLELIDGLQRISSVIQFIQPELIDLEPLVLSGCDLVPELDRKSFDDMPLALRLRIKRAKVRAVVIKRQSTAMLRYEMFKRLNTGGAELSEQEVRNCTSRMVGEEGARFYDFLRECAKKGSFISCTSTLPDNVLDRRGDEELVLRFFALKNGLDLFKGSVVDWLDEFMEGVIFGREAFDYQAEATAFDRLFKWLDFVMGDGAFVRYRGKNPIGALAPAYFEAVTMGAWRALDLVENMPRDRVKEKLIATVQSDRFRENVGSGSNSLQKFRTRIEIVENALRELAA